MNARRKIVSASLLLAGLAAAPAFAAEGTEVYTPPLTYYYVPATTDYYYVTPPRTEYYYTPATTDYYYVAPRTEYYYTAPVREIVYEEPAIVVTAPRSADRAITNDVVDVLATDSRLSGNIGVSTYRGNVELTGRVTTPGQVELAARDAKSVPGVVEVENRLRSRVGSY